MISSGQQAIRAAAAAETFSVLPGLLSPARLVIDVAGVRVAAPPWSMTDV